jgi:hypothetical protein
MGVRHRVQVLTPFGASTGRPYHAAMTRRRALAGLALLVAGCATSSPPPPARAPSAPTKKANAFPDVAVVPLPARGAFPASWAFVSKGLRALGHPELVLIVKREAGEGADAYPPDAPDVVDSLAKAVRGGRKLSPWELAGMPEGMLGRPDLTGVLIVPGEDDARLGAGGETLVILGVTKDELGAAMHFGASRVTNLLGMKARFFPFPPWIDRRRESVVSLAEMEGSLIGGIGSRAFLRGAACWRDLRHEDAPIVLRLSPSAGRKAAEHLRSTREGGPVLFLTPPPDDIEGRHAWVKMGAAPAVIMPGNEAPPRASGTFVAFVTSDDKIGAIPVEDGFIVFVTGAQWKELGLALEGARGFSTKVKDTTLPFTVQWTIDDAPAAEIPDVKSKTFVDLPPGVRYTPTSEAVNEKASRMLEGAFARPRAELAPALGTFVVAGPGLWRWLKDAPGADKAGVPSPFMLPIGGDPKNLQKLEGRSYLDADAARELARLLAGALPKGATPKLRRPTRTELAVLWALVPFDLEEPIFVVELGPRNLLAIVDGKSKIVWLDDLAGAGFRADGQVTFDKK